MSNPDLSLVRPYPFERLRRLFAGIAPPAGLKPISLGMGEPRHPVPELLREALREKAVEVSHYPSTAGTAELRRAIAAWCARRYGVELDPEREVLPCLGSREALFAFAQSHIDRSRRPVVLVPSPFYQIYEGAALLAGAEPWYVSLNAPGEGPYIDLGQVPPEVMGRVQLIYVCSPGNPTGRVLSLPDWANLFELSERWGFVIASDECYSEIYPVEGRPPLGALSAARQLGRDPRERLIVFQSLSKRSNLPGLRSGFVAGDPELIRRFLLYRTYHGSAMNPATQAVSAVAWGDEEHARANRELYRQKFALARPLIASVLDAPEPEASFYLWPATPGSDEEFARELYRQQAVTVLPGSYLSRPDAAGRDAGAGHVRMALVSEVEDCLEAARRVRDFVAGNA